MAVAVVAAGTAAAVEGAEARGAAAVAGPELELPTGRWEERRTLGLKVCPPRVFTMVGKEKERRWREGLQTGNGDLKLNG